jgi:BMFP domain-containing protein YqiC
MVQTTNRFFDEVARLMNDAAGVAQGVRREFDTVVRAQAERFLRDMDLVKREEFEAVKEMARLAREENEALKSRIAALEARTGAAPFTPPVVTPPVVTPPPRPGATPTTMVGSSGPSGTAAGTKPAASTAKGGAGTFPSAGIPPSTGGASDGDHPLNLDAPILPEK